jgi:hypothetical protein
MHEQAGVVLHVAFDERSGRIVSIHRGARDPESLRDRARRYAGYGAERIEVVVVDAAAIRPDKHYKVDISRRMLVEAGAEEGGVCFGFGPAIRYSGRDVPHAGS